MEISDEQTAKQLHQQFYNETKQIADDEQYARQVSAALNHTGWPIRQNITEPDKNKSLVTSQCLKKSQDFQFHARANSATLFTQAIRQSNVTPISKQMRGMTSKYGMNMHQ